MITFKKHIENTTKICKFYNKNSEQCMSGCSKIKVYRLNVCRFDGRPDFITNPTSAHYECPCYKV